MGVGDEDWDVGHGVLGGCVVWGIWDVWHGVLDMCGIGYWGCSMGNREQGWG